MDVPWAISFEVIWGFFIIFIVYFQAQPKKEEKHLNGPRLNDQITAQFVRLVLDEGISYKDIRNFL